MFDYENASFDSTFNITQIQKLSDLDIFWSNDNLSVPKKIFFRISKFL